MAQAKLTKKELRAAVKAYKDADGVIIVAAAALGLPPGTFKHRLRRAEAELPKKELPASLSGKGRARSQGITDEEVKATWKAFVENGYNYSAAGRKLGVDGKNVRRRVEIAVNKFGYVIPELVKPKHERSLEEDIELTRARSDASHYKARFKDAAKTIAALQDELSEYSIAANAGFKPVDWSTPARKPGKSEHMPYLFYSDAQIGEVINPAETEHAHGYDLDTFIRRYRHMIDTAIYLSFDHVGSDWEFPGIIYARGGDTISGGIHDELRETDEATPLECIEIAFENEAGGIRKLVDAFGRVEVKSVSGNHDRDTRKPQAKRMQAHSYDRTVQFMLMREFRDDDRVSFQSSESPDVYFPIYEQNILLTHGDRIGSRGGQGFIGPVATMVRGAQKVIMEQAALGRRVDRVDMGHFHTSVYLRWLLGNGCLPGYSEFAKQNRMKPEPPQQWLLFHHPRRGVVDFKPIVLGDA